MDDDSNDNDDTEEGGVLFSDDDDDDPEEVPMIPDAQSAMRYLPKSKEINQGYSFCNDRLLRRLSILV